MHFYAFILLVVYYFKFNFFMADDNSDLICRLYTWVTWQELLEATINYDQKETHNFLLEICSSTGMITNWRIAGVLWLSLLTALPEGTYSIAFMKMFLWYYWSIPNEFWCVKLSRVEGLYQNSWLVISLFAHIERAASRFGALVIPMI